MTTADTGTRRSPDPSLDPSLGVAEHAAAAPTISLVPIGEVRTDEQGRLLAVAPAFRPALRGLSDFGHVYALWWAGRYDVPEARQVLVVPLPYAEGHEAGVFACRAPVRPNLVMMTLCAVRAVDEEAGIVRVGDIDAFDGTVLLDLKPYYGCTDRVREPRQPEYLVGWDEWFADESLMPGEE
jgi:tRNA (Thr-GGU) A37 N-methylase